MTGRVGGSRHGPIPRQLGTLLLQGSSMVVAGQGAGQYPKPSKDRHLTSFSCGFPDRLIVLLRILVHAFISRRPVKRSISSNCAPYGYSVSHVAASVVGFHVGCSSPISCTSSIPQKPSSTPALTHGIRARPATRNLLQWYSHCQAFTQDPCVRRRSPQCPLQKTTASLFSLKGLGMIGRTSKIKIQCVSGRGYLMAPSGLFKPWITSLPQV
jgi:hypothetical protein